MNVADIMTTHPVTIHADQTLEQAMMAMKLVGCRHLPVLSRAGHVIGIISDRDCRTALNSPHITQEDWKDGELASYLKVSVAMSPAPIITEAHLPAAEAARLMLENHVGCLPVMRGETLIGIVTTSDILMAFIKREKHPVDQS